MNVEKAGAWFAILGTLGVVGGGSFAHFVLGIGIATTDFHQRDSEAREAAMLTAVQQTVAEAVAPIAKELGPISDEALVARIQRILKLRCAVPQAFTMDLQHLLNDQLLKYEERNHRQFSQGECDDEGRWCNGLGVCTRYES